VCGAPGAGLGLRADWDVVGAKSAPVALVAEGGGVDGGDVVTRRTLGADLSAISLAPQAAHPLFVPAASNDKGQHATLSVAVAPEVKAVIERTTHEGIATGKFPWRTPSELIRWLIVTSLHTLSTIADDERLALPYQQIVNAVEDLQLTRTQVQAIHSTLTHELHLLIDIGHVSAAKALLQHTLTDIDTLPPTPWRAWLLDELALKFPTLLDGAPAPADLQPRSGRGIVKAATRRKKRKKAQGNVTAIRG
jgi:hypothetical protein